MTTRAAPNFFDNYSADTSGLLVGCRVVAGKFVITAICGRCQKLKLPANITAADENLARAEAFALDNYARHVAQHTGAHRK